MTAAAVSLTCSTARLMAVFARLATERFLTAGLVRRVAFAVVLFGAVRLALARRAAGFVELFRGVALLRAEAFAPLRPVALRFAEVEAFFAVLRVLEVRRFAVPRVADFAPLRLAVLRLADFFAAGRLAVALRAGLLADFAGLFFAGFDLADFAALFFAGFFLVAFAALFFVDFVVRFFAPFDAPFFAAMRFLLFNSFGWGPYLRDQITVCCACKHGARVARKAM
jgi:hypothetical protein